MSQQYRIYYPHRGAELTVVIAAESRQDAENRFRHNFRGSVLSRIEPLPGNAAARPAASPARPRPAPVYVRTASDAERQAVAERLRTFREAMREDAIRKAAEATAATACPVCGGAGWLHWARHSRRWTIFYECQHPSTPMPEDFTPGVQAGIQEGAPISAEAAP